MMRLSNTGVFVSEPSTATYANLLRLLSEEVQYNDTCIGKGGFCQDQRLINIHYATRPYRRLSLKYNVFCQKYLQEANLRLGKKKEKHIIFLA